MNFARLDLTLFVSDEAFKTEKNKFAWNKHKICKDSVITYKF
jgi:hypothetical protein